MITLVSDTINNKDIDRLVDWLKTYPHLTKGPVTEQFEHVWANYIGTKYAVFVNSGSSAILLTIQSLLESGKLQKGDAVLVPAVAWTTDLSPIIQLGLQPILCDCNLRDLSIDIPDLVIKSQAYNAKALILVSVLGLVPAMSYLRSLCEKYNLLLIEDVCESLGSMYEQKKLGSFGFASVFSTYFGHHISTIEGGMVCTNDKDFYHMLKSVRSHGWARDLPESVKLDLRTKHNVTEFDEQFTFYYLGMNLRSTDLQAYIGLGQLEKLDSIVQKRNHNYQIYDKYLKNSYWKPQDDDIDFVSNFAYPVIHPKKVKIVKALKENDIQCRPLICGSLEKQPAYLHLQTKWPCKVAELEVHQRGIYVPNHPDLTEEDIIKVCTIINEVINE